MATKKELYPDFYVYVHRRASDNRVFYVGKGTADRAWQGGSKRNEHWRRIVAKYRHTVELVMNGLTDEYAQKLEIELIAFYGLENLCNQTSGGEGGGSRIWSEESKIKLSNALKGRENHWSKGDNSPMRRPEVAAKVSKALRGKPKPWIVGDKNPMHKQKNKDAVTARCKGKKRPEITGANHKLSKPVICVETGAVFDSASSAARWIKETKNSKATSSNITSACTGNLKSAYGFRWRHA